MTSSPLLQKTTSSTVLKMPVANCTRTVTHAKAHATTIPMYGSRSVYRSLLLPNVTRFMHSQSHEGGLKDVLVLLLDGRWRDRRVLHRLFKCDAQSYQVVTSCAKSVAAIVALSPYRTNDPMLFIPPDSRFSHPLPEVSVITLYTTTTCMCYPELPPPIIKDLDSSNSRSFGITVSLQG